MSRRAYAIRHVAFEDLGTLGGALQQAGYQLDYIEAGVDELPAAAATADLLVVLGGPIGVYDEADYPFLGAEIALLRQRLAQDLPTLGICLGAQLMARALDARVYPGGHKEIGWSPLTLSAAGAAGPLRHLAEVEVLHWHGDTFDLPQGASHLAASALYPQQAFAWGQRGLALQFHPEVEARGLERWYIGHTAELAASGIAVPELRRRSGQCAPRLAAAAGELWREWLARCAS